VVYFTKFLYNNPVLDLTVTAQQLYLNKENNKYKVELKPYIYFVKPKKEELKRMEYKKAIFLGAGLKNDIKININDTDRSGLLMSNFYVEDPEVTEKKFRDEKLLNRRRYGFKPFRGEHISDHFNQIFRDDFLSKFRYFGLLNLALHGSYTNLIESNSFGFIPIIKSRIKQFEFANKNYYNNFYESKFRINSFFFIDFTASSLNSYANYGVNFKFNGFRFSRRSSLRLFLLLGLNERIFSHLNTRTYFNILRLPHYSNTYGLFLEKANKFIKRYRTRRHFEKWIGAILTRFVLFKSRRKYIRFPFLFVNYRHFRTRFFKIRYSLSYTRYELFLFKKNIYVNTKGFLLKPFFKFFIIDLLAIHLRYLTSYKNLFFTFVFISKKLLENESKFFLTNSNTYYGIRNMFKIKTLKPLFTKLTLQRYSIISKFKTLDVRNKQLLFTLKAYYIYLRTRIIHKIFAKLIKIMFLFTNFSFRISKIGYNHRKFWNLFKQIFSALLLRIHITRKLYLFFSFLIEKLLLKNYKLTNYNNYSYFYLNKIKAKLVILENFFSLYFPKFLRTYYYGFRNNIDLLRFRFAAADSYLFPRLWYKRFYQHYLFMAELDEDFFTLFLSKYYSFTPIPLVYKNTLLKSTRRTRTVLVLNYFFEGKEFSRVIVKNRIIDKRFLYLSRFYRDVVVNALDDNELHYKNNLVDNLPGLKFSSKVFSTALTSLC